MRKALFLVLMTVLSGCATIDVVREAEKDFQAAAALVKENKFPEAIRTYKTIATNTTQSTMAADALFEIALIHAHHDNTGRDYAKAVRTFEEFIKRYPDNKRKDEAQTWVSALKTVQYLKKQNELLNKSIEELKRLDIQHEERRRK